MKSILRIVLFAGFLGIVGLAGCDKANNTGTTTCTDVPVAGDSVILRNFAAANSIPLVKDTSGIYYHIITQGTGTTPNDNSTVTVNYKGVLMNGTVFDSATNFVYPLDLLISGFRLGLPHIQAGGEIQLLIPSHYAYGCVGKSPAVPADAPLYFDVKLINVQ